MKSGRDFPNERDLTVMRRAEQRHFQAELARLRALIAKAAAVVEPVAEMDDPDLSERAAIGVRISVSFDHIRTLAAILPELRAELEKTDE